MTVQIRAPLTPAVVQRLLARPGAPGDSAATLLGGGAAVSDGGVARADVALLVGRIPNGCDGAFVGGDHMGARAASAACLSPPHCRRRRGVGGGGEMNGRAVRCMGGGEGNHNCGEGAQRVSRWSLVAATAGASSRQVSGCLWRYFIPTAAAAAAVARCVARERVKARTSLNGSSRAPRSAGPPGRCPPLPAAGRCRRRCRRGAPPPTAASAGGATVPLPCRARPAVSPRGRPVGDTDTPAGGVVGAPGGRGGRGGARGGGTSRL